MDSIQKIIEEMRAYKRSAWTPTLARVDEWASRLSALQREPVAWLPAYELGRLKSGHSGTVRSPKFGPSIMDGDLPLYAAPPQADGVVVPREPTYRMLCEGVANMSVRMSPTDAMRLAYKAMLAAAEKQE